MTTAYPIASSASRFSGMDADDSTMGGASGADECQYLATDQYGDGRDYHSRWYLLASGLTGGANGTVYRLHTTSTDPASADPHSWGPTARTASRSTRARSAHRRRCTASARCRPSRPLKSSGATVQSEFYLAQIEAVHAGKTVEIHLWDPGDTRTRSTRCSRSSSRMGGLGPDELQWYTAEGGDDQHQRTSSCDTRTGTETRSPRISGHERDASTGAG